MKNLPSPPTLKKSSGPKSETLSKCPHTDTYEEYTDEWRGQKALAYVRDCSIKFERIAEIFGTQGVPLDLPALHNMFEDPEEGNEFIGRLERGGLDVRVFSEVVEVRQAIPVNAAGALQRTMNAKGPLVDECSKKLFRLIEIASEQHLFSVEERIILNYPPTVQTEVLIYLQNLGYWLEDYRDWVMGLPDDPYLAKVGYTIHWGPKPVKRRWSWLLRKKRNP